MVQLMQKFVLGSHVGIFRNGRSQSTTLDPKHMFWWLHSVWLYLGSFRNCMKLGAKQGELVQLMKKFVPRRYVGIFLNERIQSAPIGP